MKSILEDFRPLQIGGRLIKVNCTGIEPAEVIIERNFKKRSAN